MVYQLTWLAGVLKDAGLKVAEVPGWESRGRADMGRVAGVICHHTAGPLQGNMPSLNILVHGRRDLAGPLSQLGLGRDGTYYVIAAGRANHGGVGEWKGISGNSRFIGIEAENTGLANDPWPEVQMDAYRRGVAAILRQLGAGPEFCVGHKEYARPLGRKPDPSFDMPSFRASLVPWVSGTVPPPLLIPAVAPARPGEAPRPTLRRGSTGEWVKRLQGVLAIDADGFFGPATEAAVRRFQRANALVADGIVGPKTWVVAEPP
jgi:hypothetical protein